MTKRFWEQNKIAQKIEPHQQQGQRTINVPPTCPSLGEFIARNESKRDCAFKNSLEDLNKYL